MYVATCQNIRFSFLNPKVSILNLSFSIAITCIFNFPQNQEYVAPKQYNQNFFPNTIFMKVITRILKSNHHERCSR